MKSKALLYFNLVVLGFTSFDAKNESKIFPS